MGYPVDLIYPESSFKCYVLDAYRYTPWYILLDVRAIRENVSHPDFPPPIPPEGMYLLEQSEVNPCHYFLVKGRFTFGCTFNGPPCTVHITLDDSDACFDGHDFNLENIWMDNDITEDEGQMYWGGKCGVMLYNEARELMIDFGLDTRSGQLSQMSHPTKNMQHFRIVHPQDKSKIFIRREV